MVVQACNASTLEVQVGGSEGQCHPWLHGELEASLGRMRCSLKIKDERKGVREKGSEGEGRRKDGRKEEGRKGGKKEGERKEKQNRKK